MPSRTCHDHTVRDHGLCPQPAGTPPAPFRHGGQHRHPLLSLGRASARPQYALARSGGPGPCRAAGPAGRLCGALLLDVRHQARRPRPHAAPLRPGAGRGPLAGRAVRPGAGLVRRPPWPCPARRLPGSPALPLSAVPSLGLPAHARHEPVVPVIPRYIHASCPHVRGPRGLRHHELPEQLRTFAGDPGQPGRPDLHRFRGHLLGQRLHGQQPADSPGPCRAGRAPALLSR